MGLAKPENGVAVYTEEEAIEHAKHEEQEELDSTELMTVPIVHVAKILTMWIGGWPGYLTFNAAGQKYGK